MLARFCGQKDDQTIIRVTERSVKNRLDNNNSNMIIINNDTMMIITIIIRKRVALPSVVRSSLLHV